MSEPTVSPSGVVKSGDQFIGRLRLSFEVTGMTDQSEDLCLGCASITNCDVCDKTIASDSCTHWGPIYAGRTKDLTCASCEEQF